MSRETRDWFGRAARPVRERWRDRWEASSTTASPPPPPTLEGGHRPKRLNDDDSGGSSERRHGDQAIEARAGALFSQAVQRDPLPPHRLIAIAERLERRPSLRPAAPARPVPRPALRRMVVRVAAGLSLLVVGGALAATATHYLKLPFGFGGPSSPSPAPAKRPLPGKIGHAPPSAGAEALHLAVGDQRPPPVIDRRDVARRGDPVARRNISSLDHQHRPSRPAPPSRSTGPVSSPSPPFQATPPSQPSLPSQLPELRQPSPQPELAAPGPLPEPPSWSAPTPPPWALPPRPAPTPLAEESALLMSALAALRRHDDAAQALAILDRHDLRFPHGDLADEAALARVEALVKVKRSDEALVFLEARGPARRGGSQRKLMLTRAELRAAAGRCAASLDELDALLSGAPPTDGVTERALWGRAACRASGGQFDLARADLERYLRLFPRGQFARGARAALDGDSAGPRRPER